MKAHRHYLIIFIAVSLLITLFKLPHTYAGNELFEQIDKNKDGTVTLEEFKENMKEYAFDKIDEDDNKRIKEEEWTSFSSVTDKENHFNLFETIDKDKNKKISFFEFSDYADRKSNLEEAFMGLDKNGNNSLSPDELTVRPLFKMFTIRF